MNKIFDIICNSSMDPLALLGSLITVVSAIYIFKSETSINLTKERHEKLIFPLFDVLEPFLYQDYNPEVLNTALKIIEENKVFADGSLLSVYYDCKRQPNNESFVELCYYIDKAYDASCRKLGLKSRPLFYRFARNQYKNKLHLVLIFLALFLKYSIILLSILVFSCFILAIAVQIFLSANTGIQFMLLLIVMLLCLSIYKYLNEH